MFNRLKTYVPIATFLVLLVGLCYLEFPVITGLIILILVVLYLCFNDGIGGKKKSFWGFGKADQSASMLLSTTEQKPQFAALLSSAGKSDKNRTRSFLAHLNGFCLQVEGRTGWRNPFLLGKARATIKSTLEAEGLYCEDKDLWLRDNNFARLQAEVAVERMGRTTRLVVKMMVVGTVEINRAKTSISDQTILWQNSVQRMAIGSPLEYALKEALESCFDALLRDYLSETYRPQSSPKNKFWGK
ncbi:MAG: hypothetical protein Q8T09_02160 [Candidatus Melainabacteria bacterium]|nr:hypothetical protein [Candidatus Melainabacteria bacterium]